MTEEMYVKDFYSGTLTSAYDYFGCHKENGKFVFRVWAPHAKSIRIVGDFNGWDKDNNFMQKIYDGIWEGYQTNANIYDNYKYCIERQDGSFVLKSDP